MMASSVIPVETILKIEDDDEPLGNGSISNRINVPENLSTESPSFISIGIQCSAVETESGHRESSTSLLFNTQDKCSEDMNNQEAENIESEPVFIKPWPLQLESNSCHNQKLILNPGFSKSYHPCNLQPFSFEDDIFLQLDYKTRNKIKTKQRRQDPFYRDQERVRQRAVMQLKRQDPCFRAVEREKGRCRMRIKRLDPVFRTQERERQRERMKLKRQDPNFRERERELQKNRIHEKRLDPEFREREKAQDRLRMRLKHNNNNNNHGPFQTFTRLEQTKSGVNSIAESSLYSNSISEIQPCKGTQINRNLSVNSNHITDIKPVIVKEGESPLESFHYKAPRVFNLHIYNDGRDTWHNSAERVTKATLLFNMFRDDINQQNSMTTAISQNSIAYPTKRHGNLIEQEANGQVSDGKSTIVVPETEKQQSSIVLTNANPNTESSMKVNSKTIGASQHTSDQRKVTKTDCRQSCHCVQVHSAKNCS